MEGVKVLKTSRKRLAKRVSEFEHDKFSFAKTGEICMLMRSIATEYLGLWRTRHEHPLPQDATPKAIERELYKAVHAVGIFYRSKDEKARRERSRVERYLVNEGARWARIKGLHIGLEVFHARLEAQRSGIAKARSGPSTGTPFAPVEEMKVATPESRTLLEWFERFYLETSQFLFEIEVEASPYLGSAKQQSKTGRRMLKRLRALLPVLGLAATRVAGELPGRAKELLSRFEDSVVKPLESAATGTDLEAKRVFGNLRSVADELRLAARSGFESARKLAITPSEWTQDHEKRFRELVGLEALTKITPEQSEELEALNTERLELHHPMPAEESAYIEEKLQATETLLKALENYEKAHGS